MKAKGIILTAALLALGSIGIAYAVGRSVGGEAQPVEVIRVSMVNSAYYGYMDSDTISGSIISRDTQSVDLDTDHELIAVYVKTGDKVRKGDKLLEYNMEEDELKADMQKLTKMGLELNLETLNKDLQTMLSGSMPVSSDDTDYDVSGSTDSYDDYDDGDDSDGSDYEDEDDDDLTQSADIRAASERRELTRSEDDAIIEEGTATDAASTDDSAIVEDGSTVSEDASAGYINLADEESSVSEDLVEEEQVSEASTLTLQVVNNFLTGVNSVTDSANASWANLASADMSARISELINTFRYTLSTSLSTQTVDMYGDTRTVENYYVNDTVLSQVGESTASVLQQAYDRLTAYQFISALYTLNPSQQASSAYDENAAMSVEPQITEALDAFYELTDAVYVRNADGTGAFTTAYSGLDSLVMGGESMVSFLTNMVAKLNTSPAGLIDTDETDEEIPQTETAANTDLDSGYDYDEGDEGYSAEDLAEAIEEQRKNIKECELQIREAELAIREYDRILDGKIVKATMDGTVKNAGTLESQSTDSSFILITGKQGLYVKGTLDELELDTIQVGDTLTGTSYDTGTAFTAEVTEISQFPSSTSGANYFYGYSDGNTNVSYYPFYAYIENADGLTVGASVELSAGSSASSSGGLALDSYFIRKDDAGKSYCYVAGEDGLLEKRYVQVGTNNYGTVEIKSGLRADDLIAFPYGDDVKDGAQTVEVDSLQAVDGEDY